MELHFHSYSIRNLTVILKIHYNPRTKLANNCVIKYSTYFTDFTTYLELPTFSISLIEHISQIQVSKIKVTVFMKEQVYCVLNRLNHELILIW